MLWHGKAIIYFVRFKLKGLKEWFSKKFGKKKDEQKPPEESKP